MPKKTAYIFGGSRSLPGKVILVQYADHMKLLLPRSNSQVLLAAANDDPPFANLMPREERRHTPRLILKRPISYEPGAVTKSSLTKRFRGVLVNMSNGGICLRTRHPLKVNMIVRLRVPVNRVFVTVPTLAQALWSAVGKKGKEYQTGLRFII